MYCCYLASMEVPDGRARVTPLLAMTAWWLTKTTSQVSR